ncbi:extracellular solute-binding protein [Cohnella endophytica]|uniref:Extracellular solute-binding protein n=1 Tax=Cohnella endophytica TaxID=2419778 RepID=A0A494Y338_9BACL|nr:extracellular solute-binding protein [Cohnella endophytica]RKP57147.1 extracellular solute-binding protein [Cohnella endophytica]
MRARADQRAYVVLLSRLLLMLAMLIPLLISCSNGNSAQQEGQGETSGDGVFPSIPSIEEDPAYGKYDEPITVNIGFKIPDEKNASGETNDNNPVSRYFEKITNIKVVHTWEAKRDDSFLQKVNLAIDSGDLPDAMVVDRNQLRKLIENDMIADLTDVYREYGSSLIKAMYDSTKGIALQDASSGGKLYGLPNVAIDADAPSLLWIRQDWLEKLHLAPPRTFDDLARIAQAFAYGDPDGDGKRDTIGLPGDKKVVHGQDKAGLNGFDTLFSAYHAFPKNWIKDSDGKVVYGSITPENKEALTMLADWYKRGIIDNEFVLYREAQEPIVSHKAGMFFGPWWAPYWPLAEAVANDTKAEWRAYAAPVDGDGKFVTHMSPTTDRFLVVRKGFEHPEAVVKMLNAFTRLERRQDPNSGEVKKLDSFSAQTGVQLRSYYPFDLLLDYADAITQRYVNIQKALRSEIDYSSLDPDTKLIYEQSVAEMDNPKKNMDGWKAAKAYEYGGGVLYTTDMVQVRGIFYGTTKTMETKWAALQKQENDTFLKIIVGDQPISAFDDFVAEWKRSGGDIITGEVARIVNGK